MKCKLQQSDPAVTHVVSGYIQNVDCRGESSGEVPVAVRSVGQNERRESIGFT